jgi:vacuolar-type H+-ATPase subunit I/STV1
MKKNLQKVCIFRFRFFYRIFLVANLLDEIKKEVCQVRRKEIEGAIGEIETEIEIETDMIDEGNEAETERREKEAEVAREIASLREESDHDLEEWMLRMVNDAIMIYYIQDSCVCV